MEIWYKASKWDAIEPPITRMEFDRSTDHCLFKGKSKTMKRGEHESYFLTAEDAKAWLVECQRERVAFKESQLQKQIDWLHKSIKDAKKDLARIEAISLEGI